MKPLTSRISAIALLALVVWLITAAGPTPAGKQPDKLVILSTTDVKGKTGPCG